MRICYCSSSIEEKNGQLLKNFKEYPGLNHKQMNDLFTHLKELFSEESLLKTNQRSVLQFIQI